MNSGSPPLPIRIQDIVAHVIDMHKDSDYQFSHEYSVRIIIPFMICLFCLSAVVCVNNGYVVDVVWDLFECER